MIAMSILGGIVGLLISIPITIGLNKLLNRVFGE